MPSESLTGVLTKKLGHGLEEVRVRTLDTVVAKLQRGFLDVKDLMKTCDFLVKLLEWFGFQPCPRQEQVLGLIMQILKEDGSDHLVSQIGTKRFLLALAAIRSELSPELCPVLDSIADLVRRIQTVQSDSVDDCKLNNGDAPKSTCQSRSRSDLEEMDAFLQDALAQPPDTYSSSDPALREQDRLETNQSPILSVDFEESQKTVPSRSALKRLLFPWQPLVSTDHHVLVAVQESLCNVEDRAQLLHTCKFITDVMMRDFPSEVFLQRPAILMTFMKLLKHSLQSDDDQLASMVIDCLTALSVNLRSRLKHYQDPSFANLKQENLLFHFEDSSSQISATHSLRSTLNREDQAEAETQAHIGSADWSQSTSQPSTSSPSQANSQVHSLAATEDDRFHYNQAEINSDRADSEDSSLLQLQQCSLPQFCVLTLHYTLPHVDSQLQVGSLLTQISLLLTECVSSQLWLAPTTDAVATDIATHLHEVLAILGELLQQDRFRGFARLTHLHLLGVTRLLLRRLVPLEMADRCLPRQLKTALCANIFDGPLHEFFPTLHSHLLQYVQVFKNVRDLESVRLYEDTLSVAESLRSAARLLYRTQELSGSEIVQMAESSLFALTFHRNLQIVPILLDACFFHFSSWQLPERECRALSSVLLKLLAHADADIRGATYSHLHKLVLNSLSVKQASFPPAESLAFLLFDSSILLEIVTHGIRSSDDKVHFCAEDIILHALKAQSLLGSADWLRFLTSLSPVLPLLQCWAGKSSSLGRAIITMLNPDVGSDMNLSTVELLKGNLRLLFSPEDKTREEAVSRLIWLLTREENAFEKLPPITRIHSYASDRVCLIEHQEDIYYSVPDHPFYQESSLVQVLELAQSKRVDPQVRLSALSQMAVMLEDPRLHEPFLSHGGTRCILETLHSSMTDKNIEFYPEAVIPAISILRSLCMHHTLTRHQLAQDIRVLYSVFRGLLMFSSDFRLQTHASQLLALLLYSDLVLSASPRSTPDGCVVRVLSVPDLVEKCMRLPFKCPTHWRTSHFAEPLMTDTLLRHEVCRAFLATAWNMACFTGDQSPLMWDTRSPRSQFVICAEEKFSFTLRLSERDLCTLQASAMLDVCHRQLDCIQTASTHQDVITSLHVLHSVLALRNMVTGWQDLLGGHTNDTGHFDKKYWSLPWCKTLHRFIIAAPASVDDQQLLVHVLRFLQVHVRVLRSLGVPDQNEFWLTSILKDPSQPLPNFLQTVACAGFTEEAGSTYEFAQLPKWKEVCRELLTTFTECALLERNGSTSYCVSKDSKWSSRPKGKENKKNMEKKKKNQNKKKEAMIRPSSRQGDVNLDAADRWVDEVVACATGVDVRESDPGWAYVVKSVAGCLKSSDTQHFYNLAFLDWLLWSLAHLMGTVGWSAGLGSTQARALFSELLSTLLELIQAFHLECGKEGSSCMGLSITRGAILCINHLLAETQAEVKDWEQLWYSSIHSGVRTGGTILWLTSLWQSRDPVVRASAMQLAAGLATTHKSCTKLLEMLGSESSALWMSPLCTLIDHDEACVVREHAANFLSNLVRNSLQLSGTTDPSSDIQRHKTSQSANFDSLLERLTECNFLSELWTILSRLSLAVSCEPDHCISGTVGLSLNHWAVGSLSQSHQEKHTVAQSPSDHCVLVHCQQVKSGGDTPQEPISCVSSTPSLVRAVCNFLDSIFQSNKSILQSMARQGLCVQLFKCLGPIPLLKSEGIRGSLLHCDTVRMYAGICRVVAHCVANHGGSHEILLQQSDTLHKLLLVLDPTAYYTDTEVCLRLRNELWTEVLWLLCTLFSNFETVHDCSKERYPSLHAVLIQSHGEPLLSVLVVALSGSVFTDLQEAALACIQSMLSHPASGPTQPLAHLLDSDRTGPSSGAVPDKDVNIDGATGSDLCRALLRLYDVHSLQFNSDTAHSTQKGWRVQRSFVACAFSALLRVSTVAKQVALKQGLVHLLCNQLMQLQAHLVLEPISTMRRLSDKKRVCPVLQDVELVMELLTNMAEGNGDVKQVAADIGVTDVVHKLWVWCKHQASLLQCALHLLVTLTVHCLPASHSIVLTTTVPGLGLRRTPSSQSLLHALVALVLQETEKASSSKSLNILSLGINILLNSCHVPECRAVLTKSSMVQVSPLLYANISKKNHWEQVERLWLHLFLQLSAHQEGQETIPKIPDMLDYLIDLSRKQKCSSKIALQVLRNVAFRQINRPRLLSSGEFLQLLNSKIRKGDADEQVAAAAAVWALTANNQKGKLTVKCAGTDIHILDSLRQLAVSQRPGADYVAKLFSCVLRVLHADNCVS